MSFCDVRAPLWQMPLPILMQMPSLVWNGATQHLDKSNPWHGHPIVDTLWTFQRETHQKWVGPSFDLTETGRAECVLDRHLHQHALQLDHPHLNPQEILLLYPLLLSRLLSRLFLHRLLNLLHIQLECHRPVRQNHRAFRQP